MSEAKDKPVDKWGREMRAGDLLRVGLNEPFTMIRAVSKWNGPRGNGPRGMEWAATIRKMSGKEADWIRADGTRWEILSRGSPADLVPDTFTPERDAEGRPVLSDEVYYAQPREVTAPGRIEKSDVNYGEGASLASTPKPEDFHTRYLAFDKRVREIVAEEAPRAKVVVDRCGTSIVGWLSQEGHEVCCSDPMDQILLEGSEELLARDFASRLLFELRLALGDRELGKR